MKEKENSKLKIFLYILSLILFIIGFTPKLSSYSIIIYLLAVILCGYDLIIEGIKNIFHLNFEEDTLMTIAVISAFLIGEYHESIAIVLLFKLGEFIETKAVEKANQNINSIASLKIKKANLINGKEIKIVKVEELKRGDIILIKPGETVPVDCKIVKGESALDTSKLTGESRLVYVNEKNEILSGSINQTGALTCKVNKEYKDSAISKIVDLVYEASNNKGKKEEYITKFSKIYTPVVIIIAVLLAIVPPILGANYIIWLKRALVFLVASCPCSIVISIPLAYFSCIGSISKKGLLIKGTKHIDGLAKAEILALDKTGTITTGKMKIKDIVILNKENTVKENDKNEIMQYIYSLEKNSNHPISNAIIEYGEKHKLKKLETIASKEIPGCGIVGKINDKEIIVGNEKILKKFKIENKENIPQNVIIIVIEKKIVGYIVLEENIREGFKGTIEKIYKSGIKKVIMLTGDDSKNAKIISNKCSSNNLNLLYKANLLPVNKAEEINILKNEGKVIFIGDGINDSVSLAAADFSIAMGEGTDIAETSADSILISNNIDSLPEIIDVARKTIKIVNENIIISLFTKLLVLILGIIGIAPIWLAVAADTGITLLTVINSIRIFKK